MTSLAIIINLNSNWRFRAAATPDIAAHNQLPWLPAQVPGHVHLDLTRNGIIADPLGRMHEYGSFWIDDRDWEYESTFHLDTLPQGDLFIRFNGLDTFAEISLNGAPLLSTDNMYMPHEVAVGRNLRAGPGEAGDNHLHIVFRSARRIGNERLEAFCAESGEQVPKHWDSFSARAFVRKAEYMFGWDWGPTLLSCGIWKSIQLVSIPVGRFGDWKTTTQFNDDGSATVGLELEVYRASGALDAPLTLRLAIPEVKSYGSEPFADTLPTPIKVAVPTGAKHCTVCAEIVITNPRRWFAAGQADGYPPLYAVEMSVETETGEIACSKSVKIGLRTIELVQEPDADGNGKGFKFRVNGHDIFAKGANWIPEDSFPSRLTHDWPGDPLAPEGDNRVARCVKMAHDAGMNMLRVWGGGLYESEHFYDLCDALGLLVWQDFPYACSLYGDTPTYLEASRFEAAAAVRRLRNRASLALWCGNNENDQFFEHDGSDPKRNRYIGRALYHEVLPAIVEVEDGVTPYWPSSPFGGPEANSEDFGDCHNWDVWHGRGDWMHYTENRSRFCSEFGFASSCGLKAWDSALTAEDRDPYGAQVRWHEKTRKGYDTYIGYIEKHFPRPADLTDLVYYSQINQAEALKYGIEHYRRNKGRCWGTLFWQLNDCWPVQSWAIVDSELEKKAAYYWCKKFYAPVLVSLVREGNWVTPHVVSDLHNPVSGTLSIRLLDFDGKSLSEYSDQITVPANSAVVGEPFDISASANCEKLTLVQASFDHGEVAQNTLLLAEPKELTLSENLVSWTLSDESKSTFTLELTAESFAPYVWLRRCDNEPLDIDDNFFHMLPGHRTLTVQKAPGIETAKELEELLHIRWLGKAE